MKVTNNKRKVVNRKKFMKTYLAIGTLPKVKEVKKEEKEVVVR